MKKIIIALGMTVAAAGSAHADSTALDAYTPTSYYTDSIDYTATASIGGMVSNDLVTYSRANLDGSPVFAETSGMAPIGGSVENSMVIYERANLDGSPTYVN